MLNAASLTVNVSVNDSPGPSGLTVRVATAMPGEDPCDSRKLTAKGVSVPVPPRFSIV